MIKHSKKPFPLFWKAMLLSKTYWPLGWIHNFSCAMWRMWRTLQKANKWKYAKLPRMQFSHTMLTCDPPTAPQEGFRASNCVCVCAHMCVSMHESIPVFLDLIKCYCFWALHSVHILTLKNNSTWRIIWRLLFLQLYKHQFHVSKKSGTV